MTKKIKDNLTEVIQIRVTPHTKNRLKLLYRLYGYKNLSKFLVECALEFPREFLQKEKGPLGPKN